MAKNTLITCSKEILGGTAVFKGTSITTTLPKFGQFLAGNRFAETKDTKLSSAWAGRHGEVPKAPFLRSVVVILAGC